MSFRVSIIWTCPECGHEFEEEMFTDERIACPVCHHVWSSMGQSLLSSRQWRTSTRLLEQALGDA